MQLDRVIRGGTVVEVAGTHHAIVYAEYTRRLYTSSRSTTLARGRLIKRTPMFRETHNP
jgi:hypothetical protein